MGKQLYIMKLNDIGSKGLHDKHAVKITVDEGGVGRAIVTDQHLIDRMLTKKQLLPRQHLACNKYLSVISKSGAFVSSPDLQKILFTSKYHNHQSKSLVLLEPQRIIIKICGSEYEEIFWNLMTLNPKTVNNIENKIMKECAEALLTHFYVSQQTPVFLFQQALSDR